MDWLDLIPSTPGNSRLRPKLDDSGSLLPICFNTSSQKMQLARNHPSSLWWHDVSSKILSNANPIEIKTSKTNGLNLHSNGMAGVELTSENFTKAASSMLKKKMKNQYARNIQLHPHSPTMGVNKNHPRWIYGGYSWAMAIPHEYRSVTSSWAAGSPPFSPPHLALQPALEDRPHIFPGQVPTPLRQCHSWATIAHEKHREVCETSWIFLVYLVYLPGKPHFTGFWSHHGVFIQYKSE